MSKYIIRNCMCVYGFVNEPLYCMRKDFVPTHKTLCQDCTDCLLKKIVEKCGQKFYDNDFDKGKLFMANEILLMLGIQEVE